MLNHNEHEILVFGKTDTRKTALEGRIVGALAYCWLFCFLMVSLFIFLPFTFFIRIFVLTDLSADCYEILHRDQKLL